MRKIMIKICGITTLADAEAAAEFGADMLGFIFVRGTPRYIAPEAAGKIICGLNKPAINVGVFRNAAVADISAAKETAGFTITQLHGDEAPHTVRATMPCIKAVELRDSLLPTETAQFDGASYLLFDRPKDYASDGWLARALELLQPAKLPKPFLIGGGLDERNAAEVMRSLTANEMFAGIDVCSSIECDPGRKDHTRLRRLIENAREAARHAIAR